MHGSVFRSALCLLAVVLAGCDSAGKPLLSNSWWNAFLDPTKPGNFHDEKVSEIQKTISFRDRPPGIPGAVDPTPDDLVATIEEYKISAGDTLRIQILDFLAPDAESDFQPLVDELGNINLPQLGWIHVEGLTPRDLQAELIQRSRDAGIFSQDQRPTVLVSLMTQQNRMYNLSGAIPVPGAYRIPRPDFRLREALNQAGGLDDSVKTIYIFRNEPREKRVLSRETEIPIGGHSPAVGPSMPPVAPIAPAEMSERAGSPPPSTGAAPHPSTRDQGGPGLELPPEEVERILMEAVSGDGKATAPPNGSKQPSSDTTPPPPQGEAPKQAPYIYLNDKLVQPGAPAERQRPSDKGSEADQPRTATPLESQGPVDWEALASENQQRIIRIPADKLRRGDTNYNIVVRNQDWIRLDAGPVGVFYLSGELVRPGVYSLTGQEITLRQAVAAAGGLNALAWPTRCEIIRRIDEDREELTQWDLARILDMKDPDLFLKPNDVIHVGTHAIAPFLATIRNSFRFTYGFGFVYDRNFADIDAFYGQSNPNERRRNGLSTVFPGLLP